MSNTDSFIDEVNEELKRDRLFAMMRKYGWIAVVAVVAIVGFAAWNEWSKARQEASAQTFGDGVIMALEHDDVAAQRNALAALAEDQAGAGREGQGRLAIVNLLLAAQSLETGDRAGALSALQAVSQDASLPASYRQLATLKRVIIAGPDLPLSERESALTELAAAGQAYRPLALEQLALLQLEAGDEAAALAQFRALLSEPDLTSDLRRRVNQLIVILGGEVDTDLG
ncbi:MAG: tetratricopeptide repeat protein [Pararhodobacter sp.]|nr:tetratricopeptide repeat protein [Pararhodobacter sp.]